MSRRDISKLRDVGQYAERLVELKLFEYGVNVAWPSAVDGTDLIAYDKGVTWQVQVKSCSGKQQRVDTRARSHKKEGGDNKTGYEYIDTFFAVNLATDQFYVIPTWIPLPGQLTVKGMPETSPELMRCPPLTCLLDAHTCDTTCDKCRPHLQAMTATDREGLLALISRCLWVAKHHSDKQKGRRGQ